MSKELDPSNRGSQTHTDGGAPDYHVVLREHREKHAKLNNKFNNDDGEGSHS